MQRLHPGVTVSLDPITTDSESEYYAKLDLAERSSRTTPDVVYEDSFLIGSDASAGYIRPLPALKSWSGWSKYYSPMQGIATYQGQIYGAMNSTDVQLIYYDANLFRKAGLPVPWQPRNWADVLHAAKELKAKDAGITPVWVYTGQALGEASSFRGFEIFLNGTNDRLFDNATNRWEVSGPGLSATWQFLANLRPYEEPESDWSSPNAAEVVDLQLMPAQQVGIVFDGSWVSDLFVKGSSKPWPGFFSDYREAQLPTETGQAPGFTNQSGGWALCVAEQSKNAALATEFIETASSAGDLATYDATAGNLPPRSDESSQPAWLYATTINPVLKFAADQIPYSSYRPGLPDYVQISNDIAVLTGEVSSGQVIAPDAAKTYESQVTAIVGARSSEHMAH
jgi:multiple sugar transport system substrate-binding protein